MKKAKIVKRVAQRDDPRGSRGHPSPADLYEHVIGREMTVPATRAKNEFAQVLEAVLKGNHAVITKHDQPKAVLISIEEFYTLSHATELALDSLADEFDALLASVQTPKARSAMRSAFRASPRELGRAAVAARKCP